MTAFTSDATMDNKIIMKHKLLDYALSVSNISVNLIDRYIPISQTKEILCSTTNQLTGKSIKYPLLMTS